MVPKEFNHGDRKYTKRKVAAWKNGLAKSELEIDQFATLVLAKAEQAGIEFFDMPLMKAEMFHDKDSLIDILVDSEDVIAEELISFVNELTDDKICEILE
jgi:hypothetical protein